MRYSGMKKWLALVLAVVMSISLLSPAALASAEAPAVSLIEGGMTLPAPAEEEPAAEEETPAEELPAEEEAPAEEMPAADGAALASGTCGDGLTWSLSEDGVLTITGEGFISGCTSSSQPWKDYRDSITAVVIGEGVTEVGRYAFYFCQEIESVVLPETMEYIGQYAFAYCSSLESINIPDNVWAMARYAFAYCRSLKAIDIPEGVTHIYPYTFRECEALTSVTLPQTLVNIGEFAFGHCDALETLAMPLSVDTVEKNAFYSCDNLTTVSYPGTAEQWYAISIAGGNRSLWDACPYDIPTAGTCGEGVTWAVADGVLIISGAGAMEDFESFSQAPWYDLASDITAVVIESGVTHVGSYTMENAGNLTSVTIEEGVQTIGSKAFRNCGLETVTVPASVTELGNKAFGDNDCDITVLSRDCVIGDDALGYGTVRGYYGSTAWVYAREGEMEFVSLDGVVPVSGIIFPDANFRAYVNETLAGGDGALSPAELAAATDMDIAGLGITDLTGLEFFPALETLECSQNGLTALDLSANGNLRVLICSDNTALTALVLTENAALTDLVCRNTGLGVLDISGCPELKTLDCAQNAFATLNLRKNPTLKALVEGSTPTVTEGVAAYTGEGLSLTLDADVVIESGAPGQEIAIDAVNFPDEVFRRWLRGELVSEATGEVFHGDADGNGYFSQTELDAITELRVNTMYDENYTFVRNLEGIEYFTALEILYCPYYAAGTLDLSANGRLRELYAYKNSVDELILPEESALEILWVYHSYGIDELDLTGCPNLRELKANHPLKLLDISACTKLEVLTLPNCALTELDVSHLPNLRELALGVNEELTELDISQNPELRMLDVQMTGITELDISQNPGLRYVLKNGQCTEEGYYSIKTTDSEGNETYLYYLYVDTDIALQIGLGDVNRNGQWDGGDAVLVLIHTVGAGTLTAESLAAADVNEDEMIDARDATQILRYVNGLETILQ